MNAALKTQLKSLSKDEQSFKQLQKLFNELNEQKSRFEQRLRLLERVTEHDYDSILITELELDEPGPRIVYVNDGFTKITGYEPGQVIGKTPRILQGPKTSREVLERLKSKLKNGRPFFGQTVNYRKDGEEFINQWDIHPLKNKEGKITHWVSFQHDITERKRAEKRVINTHAEFDELRKHSKSTVLDVDTEGTILSANKSFRNLTGYAKDELTSTKVWELFPLTYRNSLKARFEKEFEPNDFNNKRLKGIMKHKKGIPIQIEGISNVLRLKEGTIVRTEIYNISLQKRIMKALQERNEDYDKIINRATDFNYRVVSNDDTFKFDYLSETFTQATGLPASLILEGGELQNLIYKEDLQYFQSCLENVAEGRTSTCEYRIRTADGYKRVIDYCKQGTCKNDGEEECIRGAVNVLPEQKGEAFA